MKVLKKKYKDQKSLKDSGTSEEEVAPPKPFLPPSPQKAASLETGIINNNPPSTNSPYSKNPLARSRSALTLLPSLDIDVGLMGDSSTDKEPRKRGMSHSEDEGDDDGKESKAKPSEPAKGKVPAKVRGGVDDHGIGRGKKVRYAGAAVEDSDSDNEVKGSIEHSHEKSKIVNSEGWDIVKTKKILTRPFSKKKYKIKFQCAIEKKMEGWPLGSELLINGNYPLV